MYERTSVSQRKYSDELKMGKIRSVIEFLKWMFQGRITGRGQVLSAAVRACILLLMWSELQNEWRSLVLFGFYRCTDKLCCVRLFFLVWQKNQDLCSKNGVLITGKMCQICRVGFMQDSSNMFFSPEPKNAKNVFSLIPPWAGVWLNFSPQVQKVPANSTQSPIFSKKSVV